MYVPFDLTIPFIGIYSEDTPPSIWNTYACGYSTLFDNFKITKNNLNVQTWVMNKWGYTERYYAAVKTIKKESYKLPWNDF